MPDQFYDLTISEILRHYRGYQLRESHQWERARFIAWYGSLPYQKKNSSMQPQDILKLPTDPTEEEMAIMRKEQEETLKEEQRKIFEYYRSMGYSV